MWARVNAYAQRNATRLPEPLGRVLLAANRAPDRVFGRRYAAHRRFVDDHELAYDNTTQLLASVNRALADVPYYRRTHATVRSIGDFEALGFIDKDVVLADPEAFVSRAIDRDRYERCTTGGTSGKPLALWLPRDRYVVELATMHALWCRAGYRFDVRAVIRNHRLPRGTPYVIDPIRREVVFDGFRTGPDDFEAIYRTLRRFGIRFVHCYPSTAYELATVIARRGLDPAAITAFLSGSEDVYAHQRELIEGRLGIHFFNWYGHTEKLVLAGHCASTDHYHAEPTYGHCELVDDRGRAVREPGAVGEIVGTTLHNPGMPLVRYRTGDRAEYVGDHCAACGRHVLVMREIRGRWRGEKIYGSDGAFVTTTALNLHGELNGVIAGLQYVQDRKGEVTVLVIKQPQFTRDHATALERHLRERLPAGTVLELREVERLRRHSNGKVSQLISSVAS